MGPRTNHRCMGVMDPRGKGEEGKGQITMALGVWTGETSESIGKACRVLSRGEI